MAVVLCLAAGFSGLAVAAQKDQSGRKAMSQGQQQQRYDQQQSDVRPYGVTYSDRGWSARSGERDMRRREGMGMGMGMDREAYSRMDPEQREMYRQASTKFLRETLDTRKELAAKKVELRTLWNIPDADQERIKELSNEIADLRNRLEKRRADLAISNREKFGTDKGFNCPADYRAEAEEDWWPLW
jgi:hypothetical protein